VQGLFFFMGSDMHWNLFNLCLVVISAWDNFFVFFLADYDVGNASPTVLRSLRILKMVRVLRMLRLVHCFSRLRLLLESIIGSFVHLFFAFVMLALTLGLFSVLFVQNVANFIGDQDGNVDLDTLNKLRSSYGSVGVTMLSLWESVSGGRLWYTHYEVLIPTGPGNCLFFICFIGFMQITVANVLTAMIVENTLQIAHPDTHTKAQVQRRQERSDAQELKRLCVLMDIDNSGTITKEELDQLLTNPQLRSYFTVLGLDIRNISDFFCMFGLGGGSNEMDINTFVEGCMYMRGHASGIVQQNLLHETRLVHKGQQELYFKIIDRLSALNEKVNVMARGTENGVVRQLTN